MKASERDPIDAIRRTRTLLRQIEVERHIQDKKWGNPRNLSDGKWMLILAEEVGEVANAILEDQHWIEIRDELIQVAAVAVAWMDDLYEREDVIP